MSKFDNTGGGSCLPNSGFSLGGVVPKDIPLGIAQSMFYVSTPFLRDQYRKIMEKERRDIMSEKGYDIFTSGDFERMGKFIEEKVKENREKNMIKNSVFFNTDYEKVEEALKKLLSDPEVVKRFEENVKKIFNQTTVTKKDCPRLIFEYIKKKKRGVVGLLVGYRPVHESSFYVGYSLCNPKDEFDLFEAFKLAFHSMFRIQTYKNTPQSIKEQKKSFVDRCSSYFRGVSGGFLHVIRGISGGFLHVTGKDKFWADFCSLIPEEVKEKMDVDHFSFKSFAITPKKKEEDKVNVMYANRIDIENIMEHEFMNFDHSELMYKNIRFGGCTKEQPKSRCVKITWEFLD